MLPNSNWIGALDVDKVWNTKERDSGRFTVDDAKAIMLSSKSRIRVIEIGMNVYTVCLTIISFDCGAWLIICA
jgi:hypothetical protein